MADPITEEWFKQYWTEDAPGMLDWAKEDEKKRKKKTSYKKKITGTGGLLGVPVQPEVQLEPDAPPPEPIKKLTEMDIEELEKVQDEANQQLIKGQIKPDQFYKISAEINDADFQAGIDPIELEKQRYISGLPKGVEPDPEIMGFFGTSYTQGLKGEKLWQPIGKEALKEYRKKIDFALARSEWDQRINKPKSIEEAQETRSLILELQKNGTLSIEESAKLDNILNTWISNYVAPDTMEQRKEIESGVVTEAKELTRIERQEAEQAYEDTKAKLHNVLTLRYMKGVGALNFQDAAKKADETIKNLKLVPTTEWKDKKRVPEALSKLREYKGKLYIWDEKTKEYREPTSDWEVLKETVKNQPIYSPKQKEINQFIKAYEFEKKNPGQKAAWQGDPEKTEMASLYESDFTRGLRVLFGFPSAVGATLMQKAMPGTEETKQYKIAKGDTNQVLLNYALFQGVPDVTTSNKYLVDVMGEDAAWWLGLGPELILPATGIGTTLKAASFASKGLGTTARYLGTGSQLSKSLNKYAIGRGLNAGAYKLGSTLNALANPIESLKYNATAKRWDNALKLVNDGDIPAAVQATKRDVSKWREGEYKRVFDKEWDRRELSNVASEAMGDSLSELAVARGIMDSGKPIQESNFPALARYGSEPLQIKRNVDKQWNQFREAGKADPLLRRAFNEANHVRKMVRSLDEIKASQETSPYLQRATLLNKEFNDELFKLQLEKLNWTDAQKVSFFKKIAKLPPEQRTGEAMARMLGDLPVNIEEGEKVISKIGSLQPWNASLTDIQKALGASVGRTVKRGIMDFIPQDLAVISGAVVAPIRNLKNKASQKAMQKDMTALFGEDKINRTIKGEEITYQLTGGQGEKIMSMLIEEVGVTRVRQSEFYYDLMKKLADPKSDLSIQDMFYLRESIIVPALAKKNFDAFSLTEASAQWERARIPIERRGTLIKTGASGEPSKLFKRDKTFAKEGYQPSSAVLSLKDAWKATTYLRKNQAKVTEEIAVKSKSVEIDTLWRELRDTNRQTVKEFEQAIKDGIKEGTPAQAYDNALVDSWYMYVASWRANKERIVTQNYNGSFYEYFLTKKLNEQRKILEKVGEDIAKVQEATIVVGLDIETFKKTMEDFISNVNKSIDPNIESAIDTLRINEFITNLNPTAQKYLNEFIEDSFKTHTLDYDLYLEKADQWTNILQAYYNKEGHVLIPDWKQSKQTGREQIKVVELLTEDGRPYDTFASRLKDPSLSSMEQYIKEMTEPDISGYVKKQELVGKGLKAMTFKGEPMLTAALNPWAIGIRRSLNMNDKIRDFAAKYPEQVHRFSTNTKTTDLGLNPDPLIKLYKSFFTDKINDILKARKETQIIVKGTKETQIITQGSEELIKAIDDFAETVAKEHLDAMSRTRSADLVETISKVVGPSEAAKTLYPKLDSVNNSINGIYGKQLAPMFKSVRNGFKDLVNKMPDLLKMDESARASWAKEVSDLYKKEIKYNVKQGRNVTEASAWEKIENSLRTKVLGVGAKTDPYMSGLQYTFAGQAMENWRNFVQANGGSLGYTMYGTMKSNLPMLQRITNTDLALTYGGSFQKQMEHIKKIASTEKVLVDNLYSRPRTTLNIILNGIDAGRRVATSGMLGGFIPVFGGYRYMYQNIWTAPLILAAAVGKLGTLSINPKNLTDLMRIYGGRADALLFKDKFGVGYTSGEMRYLMGRYNRGMSQEMAHFANVQAHTIMKASGLTATGKNAGPVKRAVDMFDPRDFNLYARMATKTDQFFRDLVFVSAIKNGTPVEAAAKLARVSMLDYGAIDPDTKNRLSKYFMFMRFKIMMATEVFNNMAKSIDTGKPSIMQAAIKANIRAQDQAEKWLYSDDQMKQRIFPGFKSFVLKTDDKVINRLGPISPVVEPFEVLTSATGNLLQMYLAGMSVERVAEFMDGLTRYVRDGQYRPAIDLVATIIKDKKNPKHVPGEYVEMMKQFGIWEEVADLYNIRIKEWKDVRPDDVMFSEDHRRYGIQYEFTGNGRLMFDATTFLFTIIGIDRTIRDYGKAWLMFKGDTKEMRTNKYNQTPVWKYLLNLETPLPAVDLDQKSIDTLWKQVDTWSDEQKK